MRVTAIVLAAGKGRRFGSQNSKVLVKLAGRPLLYYPLKSLQECPAVRDIVLVVKRSILQTVSRLVRSAGFTKVRAVVPGGLRRQDSVLQGLKQIDRDSGLVLIHDGARPFIPMRAMSLAIRQAGRTGGAVLAVPVKATIKESSSLSSCRSRRRLVVRTLDRSRLWEVQTPQIFDLRLLRRAYRRFGNSPATDDATFLEKAGCPVAIVEGADTNIKVTTPADAVVAAALLKGKRLR